MANENDKLEVAFEGTDGEPHTIQITKANETTTVIFWNLLKSVDECMALADKSAESETPTSHEDVVMIAAQLLGQVMGNHGCMRDRAEAVAQGCMYNIQAGFTRAMLGQTQTSDDLTKAMNESRAETKQ